MLWIDALTKEILLLQPKQFALGVIIGRIEHFRNRLSLGAFFQRLRILPLREERHIEIGDIARTPETKTAHRIAVIAGNHHIIGNRFNLVAVFIGNIAVPVLPFFDDMAAKPDMKNPVGARDEPNLPAGQPNIWQFHLQAVDNLLFKKTIFITKGKPVAG